MNEPKNDTLTLTKAELNEIVSAQVKQFAAELLASKSASSGDDGLVERLALAIADISDQGTNRKRVAPEILAQRAKAHVRMVELLKGVHDRLRAEGLANDLDTAQERGLVPEYRIRVQMYLDNQLIQPFYVGSDKVARATEIFWMGAPNDGMVPLNDVAAEIHEAYRESVGDNSQIGGKWADQNQGYWVTAKNGLVVKGRGPVRQTVGSMESAVPAELDRGSSMLKLRAPIDPNAAEVAILGTVMAPAKQSQLGTR